MTCESAKDLVEPYLDDELDASLSAQVREHLAACDSCAGDQARLAALRTAIRSRAPYYRAPAGLQGRVQAALRQEGAPASGAWRWIAIAASILLAVSLAWNGRLYFSRESGHTLIAQNIVAGHIRSLMGTHLLDVPSTDQHTVKPWFDGRLDFSPTVKDLAASGFPLTGGRLDYIDSRPVAALVFQRRKHVINLFTWPVSTGGRGESSHHGYNLVYWTSAGMTYWAASDLNLAELRQFAALYAGS